MIDLYYWTTPNGHKITMFLEEAGLAYKILPVQIGKGEQFKPEFLAVAPNNRIPAMVDHEPKGGGKPISIFESGAMLLYLTNRLYGVLNKRLSDREFIGGAYSIADMASYPWVVPYKNQGQDIDQFPHLKRWLETIKARPATERAYALAKDVNPNFGQPVNRTEEERRILFGQTAAVVR
jgi:GST-like protein